MNIVDVLVLLCCTVPSLVNSVGNVQLCHKTSVSVYVNEFILTLDNHGHNVCSWQRKHQTFSIIDRPKSYCSWQLPGLQADGLLRISVSLCMTSCPVSAHNCSLWLFQRRSCCPDDYDELRCMISVLSAADLRLYSRHVGTVAMCIASHKALVRSASRAVCTMPQLPLTCGTPCPISTTQLQRSASCRVALLEVIDPLISNTP